MSRRPLHPDEQIRLTGGDAELAELDRLLGESLRADVPQGLADRLYTAVLLERPLREAIGGPADPAGLSDRIFAATADRLGHRRAVAGRIGALGWVGAVAAVVGLAVTVGMWTASQQTRRMLARINAEVATVNFDPVRSPLDSQLEDLQAEVERVAASVQEPGFDLASASPAEQFPDDLLQLESEIHSF